MGHFKEFLPVKEADFEAFFNHYCRYVNGKCTGNPPEWTHIPAARRQELDGAYGA
ncbi:MAG: hypothetical protein LBG42_07985 [Treponema sp.]|nr:hypothetical protein [Treponema sp.]